MALREAACEPVNIVLTGKSQLAYYVGVSDVFEALAAPARRAILDELHQRNGQTLFELCTRLTMKHSLALTRQAISQHLDILESVGLVLTQRQGRYKLHRLDTAPLKQITQRWSIGKREEEQSHENRNLKRGRGRPG